MAKKFADLKACLGVHVPLVGVKHQIALVNLCANARQRQDARLAVAVCLLQHLLDCGNDGRRMLVANRRSLATMHLVKLDANRLASGWIRNHCIVVYRLAGLESLDAVFNDRLAALALVHIL